ncbi:hypothetical protein CONLIGDRAFT_627470 [Coniochaeta ligniaria NRRL 30616]|uniref:Uncharacterized protein n=1 Tax=Coniochaeta ligniaria NRRL 30616 TaxID=1408157 RepID=A0A1J7JPV1_9PEZI|nr:hypothetical protein CONLIGDRAFT_627470 [Coniochaeta ligniaria NRRL 30616]
MHRFQHISVLSLLLLPFASTRTSFGYCSGDSGMSYPCPPFGIPRETFNSFLEDPDTELGVVVEGFNLSGPPSNSDPTPLIQGAWSLDLRMLKDVPLTDAKDVDVDQADKTKFVDATVIGIQTQENMTINEHGWAGCVTIWMGGIANVSNETAARGGPRCERFLPDDCVAELSRNYTSSTWECGAPQSHLSDKCKALVSPVAMSADYVPIAQNAIDQRYIFSYGSGPFEKGDDVAFGKEKGRVWPVIVQWAHLRENGSIQSSYTELNCLTAAGIHDRHTSGGRANAVLKASLMVAVVGMASWMILL